MSDDHMHLRPVKWNERDSCPGGRGYVEFPEQRGWFHQWFQPKSGILAKGEVHAIVETEDGRVCFVPSNWITFLDPLGRAPIKE